MRKGGVLLMALGLGCSSSMQHPGGGAGGTGAGGSAGADGGVGAGGGGAGGGGGTGAGGSTGAGGGGGAATDAAPPTDGAPTSGPLVWRVVTVPGLDADGVVTAIWGSGAELYVGTSYGTMFHRTTGGTWTSKKVSTRVEWIWGSGRTDVYASDDTGGTLSHSGGDDVWSAVALPTTPSNVRGIWGPSASEVLVACGYKDTGNGAILHLRGGSWTAEPTYYLMKRVWGSSATDLVAIGGSGDTLYRSSGDGNWINKTVGNGLPMNALWGSGPGDVYAVLSPYNMNMGNAYVAHSRADGSWTLERGVAVEELFAVWGSGPRDVYLGGRTIAAQAADDRGVFYHSTGDGQWSSVTLPVEIQLGAINVVWGSSATDVYVGGYAFSTDAGTVVHGTAN
jgi:hypothetical protein